MGVVVWPKIHFLPNLSAQAQKIGIFEKSSLLVSIFHGCRNWNKVPGKICSNFQNKKGHLPCVKGSINSQIFQKLGCKAISVTIASTLTPAFHRTGLITPVAVIPRPAVITRPAVIPRLVVIPRPAVSAVTAIF